MAATSVAPPASSPPRVCVIGAGIVGLTAAVRLSDAGFHVDVIARETVHSAAAGTARAPYTSIGAGALWWPFHLGGREEDVRRWATATYDALVGERARFGEGVTGVSLLPGFLLNARIKDPEWPWYAGLTKMELVGHGEDARVPKQYASAFRMTAPIVEADVYLKWLHGVLDGKRGVRFTTDLPSWAFEDVKAYARRELGAAAIVNCTGIGAREIDDTVVPGRGVLLFGKRPQPPAVDDFQGYFWTERKEDGFVSGDDGLVAYAFPRGKGRILMGGSVAPGDERPTASDDEIAGLRERVGAVQPSLGGLEEDARWVGFRPLRAGGVRLARDDVERDLWHNYGHGGGGFTTAHGCADAVCAMVSAALRA